MKTPVVHIIAGPTAGGKSAYALRRAADENGVIINADSMQLYDALPLLTAAPPAADRNIVPHRLYGVLPPGARCSAAQWRDLAHREIAAALADGRVPFLVGGTGFYIKALLDGLSPIPAVPPAIRAQVTAEQERLGNPAFHAELAKRDPAMAARLHPQDTQRLIRAREVWETSGRSLAEWQAEAPEAPPALYDYRITLILPPRDVLYDRCNRRFDTMLQAGALEEAEAFARLIDDGAVPETAPVAGALGFRALRAFLRGEIDRGQAVEKAKAQTRQYAKRQVTWFRHQVEADHVCENLI